MKQLARRIIPKPLWFFLKNARNRYLAKVAYRYDRKRFFKYFAHGDNNESQANIEAHVIFRAHQIEKGLSHVEFRDGFGKNVLKNLRVDLGKLENHSSIIYVAGLSAIKAYIDKHRQNKYDISEQEVVLGDRLVAEADSCKADISGYSIVNKRSKLDNKDKDFKELFMNRYTVREFSDEPVDDRKIRKALETSAKTPTVCNRQSFRVVIITNRAKIEQALQIQNGFHGYELPPVLALVLTDTRYFRGPSERNNIYIDGGSYMMSFLLSLEYEGLAACPLNTMFSVKEEKATRRLLGITDNYNFISYVAIGNFRDQNKVAKSFRLPVDDIIVEIK